MTPENEVSALSLRNEGATWEDTFIKTQEGMDPESADRVVEAFSKTMNPLTSLKSVKKVNMDVVGMVNSRRDKRIDSMVGDLETQLSEMDTETLAPFRATFEKNKNDNVRSAAEAILMSDAPAAEKKASINRLVASLQRPQDDVQDYAHETVQENKAIPAGAAAHKAEQAADYVNNTPIGMMKTAIRMWQNEDTFKLANVQSLNPFMPSDVRTSRVMESIGYGNKDVRGSSSGTVEDSFRAWEQDYGSASTPEKRRMVSEAVAAINKEANGDKLFAMDALEKLFEVSIKYNDTGDYRQAETAAHKRALKGQLISTVEWGGAAADVGSLADVGVAFAKAGKEGVGAVKAIKEATGATTSEAVDVLKVGYGVKKTAERATKRAANAAKEAAKQTSKAAEAISIEPGTAASIDALINPERIKARMLASFGDDTGQAAAYGTDEVTSLGVGALPRASDEALKDIPYIGSKLGISKAYDEAVSAVMTSVKRALSGDNHFFLRKQELANIAQRSADELATAFKDRAFGEVAINKSAQVNVDNGFITQYVVTGKDKAFTAEEALDAATVYNTEFDDIVRLLKKDEVSGEWRAVPAPKMRFDTKGNFVMAKQPEGQYALGVVRHKVYDESMADGSNLVKEGHIGGFSTQLDKSSMFAKDINDMGTWAEKQRGMLEHALADTMKSFNKLGGSNVWRKRKAQARVLKAINSGAGGKGQPGQFYNSDELVSLGLTNPEEMSAYYAIRARFDAEYFLNNIAAREDMVRKGFSRQVSLDGHTHFLKAVKEDAIADKKFVVNTKGEVVAFNKDEYLNGEPFQVFQLKRAVSNGGGVHSDTMVVRASDTFPEGAAYGKLGDNVLPYHEGYVPRMYEAKYVITKAMESLNDLGKRVPFEKAVATSRNYRHALKYALENGLTEKDIRLAREAMQPGRGVMDAAGKARGYNGVIFGRRGTQLEDAEVGHLQDVPLLDGDRNLKTLSDVLASSSGLTSYRKTMEQVINRHIDRWNKSYGVGTEYGWNLATIKAAKESTIPAHADAYSEAVAFRDHIAMLQGSDETVMNTALNSFRAVLANSAATGNIRRLLSNKLWDFSKTADVLEDTWRDDIGRDLASRIKNVNFTLFMGLNPAAQLVLQSSQVAAYIGLKGGLRYATTGQYTRDFIALSAGINFRGKTDAVSRSAYDALHKAAGYSREDFDAMVDAFDRSGILQGIDRHQYLDAVTANAYRTEGGFIYGSGVGHYADQIVTGLRKIGFNAGETVNQTSAWLFARQRMLANNPKLTARMLDTDENLRKQVVVMGTNIGGNMDNSARLRHQDGLLGVILQFTSYGTKMSQMMIPRRIAMFGDGAIQETYFKTMGRFGSDIYTTREKLFVSLTQLGLFGTMGTTVGVVSGGVELPGTSFKPGTMGYWLADTWLQDEGVDANGVPSYAREAITQGFIGATANAVFTELYDEKTSVDWAARFAPIGNLKSAPGRMFEIANSIAEQDYSSVTNFLAGPSMTQVQKLVAASEAGGNAFMRAAVALKVGYAKPETGSDLAVFYDKIAQLAPALNNWKQGEFVDKTGYFRTADGSRSVEANGAEKHLRMLFGLRPMEELAIGGVKNQMAGAYGEVGYGDAEGVQKLANAYWKELKLKQALLNDGKMPYSDFENQVGWMTTMTLTTLNPMEQRKLNNLLAEKRAKDSLESKDKAFVNEFAKKLYNYDLKYSTANYILSTMPEFEGKRDLMERVESHERMYADRYNSEE